MQMENTHQALQDKYVRFYFFLKTVSFTPAAHCGGKACALAQRCFLTVFHHVKPLWEKAQDHQFNVLTIGTVTALPGPIPARH